MSQSTQPSQTASAAKPPRHPEKKIGPFANGVGVSIWLNTVETDNGPKALRSITINPRRYFDRESNQWKDAGSYNLADLPALIFSLTKAQEYVYETPLPGEPVADGESPPAAGGDIPF